MRIFSFVILCALAFPLFAQDKDPYHRDEVRSYDSKQIDFSKEFYNYTVNYAKEYADLVSDEIREGNYSFDTNSLFCTPDLHQNGVLGSDYRRIRMHVSEAVLKTSKEALVFQLKGKTNVEGNICDFDGEVTVDCIYKSGNNEDEGAGILVGHYNLSENKQQPHPGIFKGTFVCSIIIDDKAKTIKLDDRFEEADGYSNKDYVGVWKSHDGKTEKKCIWGDYRLPYTFDFDQGDGEMIVNEKYIKNGWQSYMDGSEFTCDEGTGNCQLKDKWWKNK